MTYRAPLRDMRFVIEELADLSALNRLDALQAATPELTAAVLEEAARLAADVIAPTNRIGDREGARLVEGEVVVPQAFHEAYRQYQQGGWPSLPCDPAWGGQGLPHVIGTAVTEMWVGANLAFSLCPMLAHAAIDALQAHADETLRKLYLPKLVSGEWAVAMSLTEPQAGSDLSATAAIAEPEDAGATRCRLRGRKIFITWGDHSLTENIVHLVLARLPGAPEGVRGISLFLVPKYLPREDGTLGERNDLRVMSLEEKLGIHASPTCAMSYGDEGGAVAWRIGEAHQGLACMFTMMNHARLSVGVEGLAVAEAAYQRAVAYARERVQGRLPGGTQRVTIIHHPDVRRMLMTMRSGISAMRALAYSAAATMDLARHAVDEAARAHHRSRLDLLTPVVKGWCTELGQEIVSLGLQVHGGMGYIEETGVAQQLRDARITSIYEGTNGIQGDDLARRKIARDGGAAMESLIAEMEATCAELDAAGDELAGVRMRLHAGVQDLRRGVRWLLQNAQRDPFACGSAGFPLLMLTGTVAGGWQLARAALRARSHLAASAAEREYYQGIVDDARFYVLHLLPRSSAWLSAIEAGSEPLMSLPAERF